MDVFLIRWIAFDDVYGRALPHTTEELARDIDPQAQAASNAVEQLLRGTSAEVRRAMGMVIGTTLGSLEQDRRFDESRRQDDGRYASPAAFTRTLPNTIASELSIRFGIGGPTLVVSAGGASTLLAIAARFTAWMRYMGVQTCLTGGLEWLGPGVADETGSVDRDRCRGALCLLSQTMSPGGVNIFRAGITLSALRASTHLDASMMQLTDALQSGSAREIIADSGDGMTVKLAFGDR